MYNLSKRQASALRHHRERVRSAKPLVDSNPPVLDVQNVVRMRRLEDDINRLVRCKNENYQMVKDILMIIRGKGVVDSFPDQKTMHRVKISGKLATNKRIQEDNFEFHRRLLTVKAETKTHRSKQSIYMRSRSPPRPNVPYELLSKYSSLKLPESEIELNRLLRPCIYFDLELKDLRPLGRVVIQLYTEASPLVVVEFLRMCSKGKHELLRFERLFPSLWLEGELKVDPKSKINVQHEYDMRALDNSSGPGILSYSRDYTKGFRPGLFNFSISFKPLSVVNGRRIAFGRVVAGMSVLTCIETNGTKMGRPIKEVVVSQCGLMSKKPPATQRKTPLKYVRRTSAEMQKMSEKPSKKLKKTKSHIYYPLRFTPALMKLNDEPAEFDV